MTFAAEAAAIESRLSSNWTTTPIKYDNVDYVPTAGQNFVELIIDNSNAAIAGFGSTSLMYRMRGIISINIFTSLNTGTRTARGYADTIATLFRAAHFSGIICGAPNITRIGQVEDWFVINVSVTYYRNENF